MNLKKKPKKYIFYSALVLFFILIIFFIAGWIIVDGNYDKQNRTILFLKKIIPNSISRKIRDTVFIIPDLKTINKDLSLQVKKYEQGLNGQLFEERIIYSSNIKAKIKNYFLPFPRLDVRAGYNSKDNRNRAHYLEIINDKIIVISGEGKTIFFEKKNIYEKQLNQIEIKNNLLKEVKFSNNSLAGIRDLFYKNGKLYVSVIVYNNQQGYSYNIYYASFNLDRLNFELIFETKTYFKNWSVSSGGRIEDFGEDKILFSYGFSDVDKVAQDKNSLLGKIISINLITKEYEIISLGHRNPQGLQFIKDKNLIINSEHGPKGGDEINFNYYKNNKETNFGWDVASYGINYDGTDPYKKSHKAYNFVEPFKVYPTSIGISEIYFLEKNESFLNKNTLVVSSLRAGSLYVLELDDNLNKIDKETRIYIGNERIRDLKYDKRLKTFFLIFEMTPSISAITID